MKTNPTAIIGLVMLTALIAASGFGWSLNAVISVALIFAALVVCIVLRRSLNRQAVQLAILILFSLSVGFALMSFSYMRMYDVSQLPVDESVHITGTVSKLPEYNGRYTCEIDVETLNDKPVENLKIEIVSKKYFEAQLYDGFDGDVTLYSLSDGSSSISACAYFTPDGERSFTQTNSRNLTYWLSRARTEIIRRLDNMFSGEVRAFIKSITIGDSSELNFDLNLAFSLSGLSHVIVVSGMHFSLVCGGILKALTMLSGAKRKVCAVVALISTLLFAGIIGVTPSVRRASCSMILSLIAILLDEDMNSYTSLGASVIITAIANPLVAVSKSFVLSVFSVLGIYAIGGRINSLIDNRVRLAKPVKLIVKALSASVGAQLAVTPIVISYFSNVSVVSLLSNLLTCTAVSFALACSVMAAVMSFVMAPVSVAFGVAAGVASRYCLFVVDSMAKLPFASVYVSGNSARVATVICLVVVVFGYKYRKPAVCLLTCVTVIALSFSVTAVIKRTSVTVTVTLSGCIVEDSQHTTIIAFGSKDSYGNYFKYPVMYMGIEDKVDTVICNYDALLVELLHDIKPKFAVSDSLNLTESLVSSDCKVLPADCIINSGKVKLRCYSNYTVMEIAGKKIAIAAAKSDLRKLGHFDMVITPGGCLGESDKLVVTDAENNGLVTECPIVYNVVSELTVTVFDNGKYYLRNG